MKSKKTVTKKRTKARRRESELDTTEGRIIDVAEAFEFLKILAYGQNGKGKTHFGATAPKPLIIDCNEQGTLSVRNFKDVKVFHLEQYTDIDLIYWYLHAGNHDRETVVLDTVSSLSYMCMKHILGDEADKDPSKDPAMPGQRDWGKLGELMRETFLKFRNLPMHTVFLAQERRIFTDEDDFDDAPEVFPEVSPAARTTLTSCVNIIGRMYVKEVVRKQGKRSVAVPDFRMMVGPSERYVTKVNVQDHGLPKILRNPSIEAILTKLKEG